MRKYGSLVLCILILFLSSCAVQDKTDEKAVATANGEIITEEEFEYFRKKYKAEVLNNCLEDFSAEYTDDFWEKEFEGITPEEILYEKALEECVKAKIQFLLMKEEGIYDDITFSGLRDKAESFNAENENKEGVVGIKSIQMSQFYSYYLQTGIMELQNVYAEGKLKPSEEEIKDRIALMDTDTETSDEQDYERFAISKLKTEKYENYINELYSKAEIKEIDKDGKQS